MDKPKGNLVTEVYLVKNGEMLDGDLVFPGAEPSPLGGTIGDEISSISINGILQILIDRGYEIRQKIEVDDEVK